MIQVPAYFSILTASQPQFFEHGWYFRIAEGLAVLILHCGPVQLLAGFLLSAMTESAEGHERNFFLRKLREFSTVHLELLRLARGPVRAL